MDKQLPSGALGHDACEALAAKIHGVQPALLAFTSLTAGRRYLRREAVFGEQKERIGETRLWVLSSPSPTANWNWDESWWLALAERAKSLWSANAPPGRQRFEARRRGGEDDGELDAEADRRKDEAGLDAEPCADRSADRRA